MAIMAQKYRVDHDDYPVGSAIATVGPFETYEEYAEFVADHQTPGGRYAWQPHTIQSPDEYPHGKAWYL